MRGKPLFDWKGDEAEGRQALAKMPEVTEITGMHPVAAAAHSIESLQERGCYASDDLEAQSGERKYILSLALAMLSERGGVIDRSRGPVEVDFEVVYKEDGGKRVDGRFRGDGLRWIS